MNVSLTNLQSQDVEAHYNMVRGVIETEFPELNEMYDEILIIIGNERDIQNRRFEEVVTKFFGERPVSLTSQCFPVKMTPHPPKGCIEINLSIFETYAEWKQKFSIRHECCHLLNYEETPTILDELRQRYPMDYLKAFIRYQHEFLAHSCCIQRYPEDWLREPLGFNEAMPSPRVAYREIRERSGRCAAIYFAVQNMVHLLSLLCLYDNVPSNFRPQITRKREIAEGFLKSFFQELQNDAHSFPPPNGWIGCNEFLKVEGYLRKVQALLSLVG